LASVLGAMTPLTSTMAVCFLPLLISARPLQSTAMTRMKVRYAKVSSLKKMPQRRARRCSFRAAVARLVTRSRSHCGLLSVIVEPHEVDRAVALLELQLDQRGAVAGSAQAAAACRFVERTVRRRYQMASIGIEKFPFLPIQFHRDVRASVQVAVHPPILTHGESRRRGAEVLDLEARAAPAIGELGRGADQPCVVSH